MTYDEIADLADRVHDRLRRGEGPEFEFAIEFGGLTEADRDAFMALVRQRTVHAE